MSAGPVAIVNPTIAGTLQKSNGYVTAGNGSRTPNYDVSDASFQVQALTAKEIQHLDSLNITGKMQAVHFPGRLEAMDRSSHKGGDVLTFDGADWLVVQELEYWPASGWSRVAVQKQLS